MSYPIGSKFNTRGKAAVYLPCVRCGTQVRVYQRPNAVDPQRAVTSCAPCHNAGTGEITSLILDLEALVVRPAMAAWRQRLDLPTGLVAWKEAREAYRQQVWARAVADSLAERGVPNACAPTAVAV